MSSLSSASQPSSSTKSSAIVPDVVKPNPHPYAVKTTSTGILSRSSSTSSSAHSYNHYVPVSPSPSPTKQCLLNHSERGSRHRYSRSLTDESSPRPLPVPQDRHDGRSRSRIGSFSESFEDEDGANPKSWEYEQLAANVPEIADFVREHEITGRAFLRFDNSVLDAYGITHHWQRSLILDHSRKLKQSMLRTRDSNTSSDFDAMRLSQSDSLSSFTGQPPLDEDDSAYLSSSSSISSTSSTCGHTKRRLRPNGRVHGLIASYERSASPDKTQLRRDRNDSISSIHDEHRSFPPQYNGDDHDRLLPFPSQLGGEYVTGPLLLPQASFPNSFPQFRVTHESTGNSGQATLFQNAVNDVTDQTMQPTNYSRPLPATPVYPSLRPSVLDENFPDNSAFASKKTSGEMTMDDLGVVLDYDAELTQPQIFVNMDRRNAKIKSEKRKIAAAWEMDNGGTIKHVPPIALPTVDRAQPEGGDDELTVEELLALEGIGGATAWVNEPEGIEQTMKHVGCNGQEIRDPSRESIRKRKGAGKGVGYNSLSTGRKSQSYSYANHQVRRVGELFSPEQGVNKAHGEEKQLERMREVERQLRAQEEEQESRATEVVESRRREDARADDESELRGQDERLQEAKSLYEVSQSQQCMAEDTQKLREELEARDLLAAEQQRQEGMEQRLASSIAETCHLLEEFRRRLELIEQRVEHLETELDPSNFPPLKIHENSNTCVVQRLRNLATWALSTSLPTALGVPLADFVRGPDTSITRLGDGTPQTTDLRRGKSKKVSVHHSKAFPRYSLILGLGICAFILRRFLRLGTKGVRIGPSQGMMVV